MSNKTQLQTNNSELQDILEIIATLPNAADLGVGTYIWQKSVGGGTTEYVVSDDPSAYPDDGEQGGFTYKKIQATETTEITPGTADQTIPALSLLLNTLTVKGDADLVAKNIRSGVDIFGVIGTMVQGKTGIDYGTVQLAYGDNENQFVVSHNLRKVPSYVALLPREEIDSNAMHIYSGDCVAIFADMALTPILAALGDDGFQFTNGYASATSSRITFNSTAGFAGFEFIWFAVA